MFNTSSARTLHLSVPSLTSSWILVLSEPVSKCTVCVCQPLLRRTRSRFLQEYPVIAGAMGLFAAAKGWSLWGDLTVVHQQDLRPPPEDEDSDEE